MIVPQYWAEAREKCQIKGRQITVRRFGWSELSPEEAEAMARRRVAQAIADARAGNTITRREPKVAYNGANGVPIREEVVARIGSSIITRNSYGALCLNSPDTLFADIDFEEPVLHSVALFISFFLCFLTVFIAINGKSNMAWLLTILPLIVTGLAIKQFLNSVRKKLQYACAGGIESWYRQQIEQFIASQQGWGLRLYRTPAGFRLIATHRVCSPDDPEVAMFFKMIGVDPLYQLMCHNQKCFRARLTAKPWRIGISDHLRPRPGVWPINPEKMHLRTQWLENYDKKAAGFAACRFIQNIGDGPTHPALAEVISLHDSLSRALEIDLEIA